MDPRDAIPRFLGCDVVPALGGHLVYRERWVPGSRARARMGTLRLAGIVATSSQVTIPWPASPTGRIEVTELRVEPAPAQVPMVSAEDMMAPPSREMRRTTARIRALGDEE